jgi:hypothetical protein
LEVNDKRKLIAQRAMATASSYKYTALGKCGREQTEWSVAQWRERTPALAHKMPAVVVCMQRSGMSTTTPPNFYYPSNSQLLKHCKTGAFLL